MGVANATQSVRRKRNPEVAQSGIHPKSDLCKNMERTIALDPRLVEALERLATSDDIVEIESEVAVARSIADGHLKPLIDQLERRASEVASLRRLALTDPMTGVANRRAFDDAVKRELKRSQREGTPVSVIVLDLDCLKMINDTLGHAEGDVAIEATARACVSITRGGDLVGRLGGDEFAILLPGADESAARACAERVRAVIESVVVGPHRMGVSLGVATFPHTVDSADEFIKAADAELYADKRSRKQQRAA